MSYLIPAAYTGMSSYSAHTRRNPPSSEPGVDYYMPTGTPLGAPARCRVVDIGGGVQPATGRYVTVDDGTRWLRYLHLSRWMCKVGDVLEPGQTLGLSGASGYGSEFFGEPSRNSAFWRNTGGDHVHVTAFNQRYYVWGSRGSTDFHAMTGGKVAGSNVKPIIPEEDDMKLLHVTDSVDGNGVPGWALLNTRTGKLVTLRNTVAGAQDNANSWARVWGDAKSITRQDMLNAIAAIQQTS